MLDHLADLEADFLVFYRIEDIHRLDGPRFMRLAWRVSAYGGVMKLRLESQRPVEHYAPEPRASHHSGGRGSQKVDVVPLDQFAAQFPGLVTVTTPSQIGGE